MENTQADQIALKLSLLLDAVIDLVLKIGKSLHLDLLMPIVFEFLTDLFDLLLKLFDFSFELIVVLFELA